jgi:hypothetical protein
MRWTRPLTLLGVFLAAAGLLVWALWGKLEWSERDVWVGYSGEARFNDFLAGQRLLERMGQRASSLRGLPLGSQLPGRNDVILLPRRQTRLTPGQAETVIEWVKRGGLLITEGLTPESRDAPETQDPLFRAVGARMVWRPERPSAGGADTAKHQTDLKSFDEANRNVRVEIDGRSYQVRLGAWEELLDLNGKATRSAQNSSGIKLLQYDLGQGRVILCTELSCLANGNLAEEDHAGFLSAMALDWGPQNRVWIVYREEPPSLWRWLRDHAWMVMTALLPLVGVGLWSAASRFGPRIPDPHEGRRSLLEHLRACGRFQWAQRDGVSLLRSAREATLSRLHRVHPGWGHLAFQELCTQLSAFSGLHEERIARALRKETLRDPREFTEVIQTLDLIRKKL